MPQSPTPPNMTTTRSERSTIISSSTTPTKTTTTSQRRKVPSKASSLPSNSSSLNNSNSSVNSYTKPPKSPTSLATMRRSRSKSPVPLSASGRSKNPGGILSRRKRGTSPPPLPDSLPLAEGGGEGGGDTTNTTSDNTASASASDTILEEKKDEDDDDEIDNEIGPGSKFHDALDARSWDKLEALLKKFDYKYWRKIRHRIEAADALDASKRSTQSSVDGNGSVTSTNTPEQSPAVSPGNSPADSPADSLDDGTTPNTKRKLGISVFSNYWQDRSAKRLEKERALVSPLLTKDNEGNTPLHLAFQYRCPERLMLLLMQYERTAANVANREGQLPLHVAVAKHTHDPILDKIIKAYPNALKTKDRQGRTPIGLAVEIALQKEEDYQDRENDDEQDEDGEGKNVKNTEGEQMKPSKRQQQRFYWGKPSSDEEGDWQFRQEKYWGKVDFLLKDLMKRNKHIIPSEHGLILESLEGGAPPKCINRLISTTDKYLLADDDLAGSAITLCVKRRYRLDTLEYLLENCNERTTMIVDYTHKVLVTHYRFGCQPLKPGDKSYGKELIDWAKTREKEKQEDAEEETSEQTPHHPSAVEDLGEEKEAESDEKDNTDKEKDDKEKEKHQQMEGVSVNCREWWDTMQHVIFYCAYGKDFQTNAALKATRHLLHAALAIPATPPSLVQLILLLQPESRTELCPVFQALPVHIMCTRWKHDLFNNEKDKTMERVIKGFLKPQRELLSRRHRGRLPIHLALEVGQGWSFLKPLVSLDKKSIGMRDPHTKLFPFQMAAMKFSSKNIAMVLRTQYTPGEWRIVSTREKREEYTLVENRMTVRQVGTIFELLRRYPGAITGKVLSRGDSIFSKDLDEAGPVSIHYLSWVYGRGSRGWKLRPANVKVLRDSILNGNIARPLRPWWERLKAYIWDSSKNDALPQTNDYLLHAALYNPDTPPLVIELILELYPMSAAKPVPGTDIYPLHIASGTSAYHAQPFEIPNRMDSLRLILAAYKPAVKLTLHGRLPLHICISRGKAWGEMKPLVQSYRQSLMAVDPQTGLAPFQLMSIFNIMSKEHVMRFSNMAARQARAEDMDSMTVQERARFFRSMKKKQDLDSVTSIFELLRAGPNAIYALTQESTDASEEDAKDMDELGEQSTHLGIAATLDQFLNDIQQSPMRTRKHVLSPQKDRNSLGNFLRQQSDARNLVTPIPAGRPSLGAFLSNGNGQRTSARSLISKESGALHNDYVKPSYDDDLASFMSPSVATTDDGSIRIAPNSAQSSFNDGSFGSLDASQRTPDSSFRRGKVVRRGNRRTSPKRTKLPINLPDLEN